MSDTDYQEVVNHVDYLNSIVARYPDGQLRGMLLGSLTQVKSLSEQLMTGTTQVMGQSLGSMS